MANVKTFDLDIFFAEGDEICFSNISRVAVARYVEYYSKRIDFVGFHYEERR